MSGPLPAQERVLPTLNADGSRRRIRPKLHAGRWWRARVVTGWALIALFVALPFVKMNGHPVVLLDIPSRQFHLLGRTFLATDGVLLMLLLLSIFVLVIWLTALLGRGWCGWACPQTVYMELLFRPIERLIEGDRPRQIALDKRGGMSSRRALKNLAFAVLSVFVANVFLAYFVGVERLSRWVSQSPLEHPVPFMVMATTAALVMLDFAWFREQMCTVACPYARLQSVLLDRRSLVVAYDPLRGEPRSKGKPKPGSGDCIDCGACVVACPTGIDIREGLQLECIACTQCIDACDSIMAKLHKPAGLVRYSSQEAMETRKRPAYLRPRVLIYPAVLVGFLAALFVLASRIGGADVTILRGIGAPFVEQPDGIQNQIRVKVENRSGKDQRYQILLLDSPDAKLIAPENPLRVRAGTHESTSVFVIVPRSSFRDGQRLARFCVSDESGFEQQLDYKLLGPRDPGPSGGGS